MLSKRARLPEPVKGRIMISSQSSLGIPQNLKTGDKTTEITESSPLAFINSIAQNIATKYGKIVTTRLTLCLAPPTKQW